MVDAREATLAADWLGASRRAAEALHGILADAPTTAERVRETGQTGEGGDRTLVIDADAEAAVVSELERLHDEGARFTLVSEELGTRDFGSPDVLVVVDPIDGSTNAKRGLPHHSISIAVADGPTAADVAFGFVYDFGPEEEWTARRGQGAFLDGVRLDPQARERRSRDGRVELLGLESADPRRLHGVMDGLCDTAYRIRVIGSMAVTLCQVAAARLDAMVTLRPARSVDVAAGQLIVREAGGLVCFCACEEPLGAPLVIEPASPVVAARSAETLHGLTRMLSGRPDA